LFMMRERPTADRCREETPLRVELASFVPVTRGAGERALLEW
jgi:hypothetical protein